MDLHGLDAIIFDFDGVLVESVGVKSRAFATLYKGYGKNIVAQIEEFHLRNGGMSRFDKFRYFQTKILGEPPPGAESVAALADAFSALVVDEVVAEPMVQGAQSFLEQCHRCLLLFVVSGTPATELSEIIERRNLAMYFAATRGSPTSKAQNISDLLKKHKISANRCVMMGDAIADYDGATSNNVAFLGRVAANDLNPFSSDIRTFTDFCDLPASWKH